MDTIRFGTDGWRAIIAKDFTVYNVARVAQGLAGWLSQSGTGAKVVIGYDCRFGGPLFAATAAGILCRHGIHVVLGKNFASTPMVSLAVRSLQAQQGVVITASHNPSEYNGFKLKGAHGGPSGPEDIAAVEALIPGNITLPDVTTEEWVNKGMLDYIDLEQLYMDYLHNRFDMQALNNSPGKLAFDAMYGAGRQVIGKALPAAVLLHCASNPSFGGTPPEPIHKNLQELSYMLQSTPELKIGLATDGDADRLGLYDEDGHFVDAHHIILLLIQYLHQYKKLAGRVVIAFSVTDRVKKMCAAYGIPVEVTPIGFKYISEKMMEGNVLLGGEESGGIAITGHIPERDGIYNGLIIYEYMNETGKTLKELCEEVYAVTGRFAYERDDLHIPEEQKRSIMQQAETGGYKAFGTYKIQSVETTDGIKYHLDNDCWVMLRASGTEPLLRIYAEGNNREEALDILAQTRGTIL